jgi:acylaminoacyl-peptidase
MIVPEKTDPMVKLPAPPKGAQWAPAATVVDRIVYRMDGRGMLQPGYTHAFVVPADGGTPRQLTQGNFDHNGGIAWRTDSDALYVTANRRDDAEFEPLDTAIWEVPLRGGSPRSLTPRYGPDGDPVLAPGGRHLALRGFEDDLKSFNAERVSVIDLKQGDERIVTSDLDRAVNRVRWRDASHLYIGYDDAGIGRIDQLGLDGRRSRVVDDLGGTSITRPYSGGVFDAAGGTLAYTVANADRPAELAVVRRGKRTVVTDLNSDALAHRAMAPIQPITVASSVDGRQIEAWVALPPGFEAGKRYPLILEIHGGPFTAYGPHFSAEVQLYAAAGYVVVYANPRGSTSYGTEFANLIHHAYPGDDYHDLMSVVDAAIANGWADPDRLFVTGGSGGGILTAWIVTQTDRFQAAVAAKPVINWASFVLTADMVNFFARYWFGALPWEDPEAYRKRSPISYIGNVKTPTLLMTGEADLRTPISEAEQFYQALKLARVDTALVRIPGASHGIANRPSHLIAKVEHVLAWFARYDPAKT